MTSGHKLAAIIVIWVVAGSLAFFMPGMAYSVNETLAVVLYGLLIVGAALATGAVGLAPAPKHDKMTEWHHVPGIE
jgi:hypothetical protein